MLPLIAGIKSLIPRRLKNEILTLKKYFQVLPDARRIQDMVAGKTGLEIGGPSDFFKTHLPLYKVIKSLDGVNFSDDTLWEGKLVPGDTFRYLKNRTGKQFICEATDLDKIKNQSYDFVLSCNNLEHIANPLKALVEWRRILVPGGLLILVLPNQIDNFDHRRPVTTINHLLEDLRNDTPESDLTHIDEILELHDLGRDIAAGTADQFRQRSLQNFHNRGLHHHVFDQNLLAQILIYLNLKNIYTFDSRSDFIAIAVKETK